MGRGPALPLWNLGARPSFAVSGLEIEAYFFSEPQSPPPRPVKWCQNPQPAGCEGPKGSSVWWVPESGSPSWEGDWADWEGM